MHETSTISASTPKTVGYESETVKQEMPEVSMMPDKVTAPLCPGSCVAPLFSLLCDSVVEGYHCPNEGRCCISTEESEPEPTTTTPSYPHLPSACPGACIPVFLRGMCNRPSEVIIQSDCDRDFVCCYQPDVKDNLHVDAPQIPLLRPGSPPQGYLNSPYGLQGNRPPMRQPNLPNPHNQRPQVPHPSNHVPSPVLVPHVHDQHSESETHLHNNHPGYPHVHNQPSGPDSHIHHNHPGYPHVHNQPSGPDSHIYNNHPGYPPVHNEPSGSVSLIPNNKPGYPPMHNKPTDSDSYVPNNPSLYPPVHNKPIASDQHIYNNRPSYPPTAQIPPHLQNLPNVYDIHEENDDLGYIPIPPMQSQQGAAFGLNPSPNNIPNYPNGQQNFLSRPQYYNSSSEIHPVGQQMGHDGPDVDQMGHHFYDRNKQNVTRLEFPQTFVNTQEETQPGKNYGIPSRINLPIIQNPKPVMQPEEFTFHKNQNNDPNRFVDAPIRFDSDRVRPTIIDLNNNPPNLEKFHPIITPNQPPSTSSENNKDDSKSIIHIPLNVQLMEKIPEHSVQHSSEAAGTSFIPVQDNFRPFPTQQNPSTLNQVLNKPLLPNQRPTKSPTPIAPSVETHNYIPVNNVSVSNSEPSIIDNTKKDSRPECPGSCIGSFLRFTCFGSSVIYDGFGCESEGSLCCTPVEHVQKYEEHLKFGKPLVLPNPEEEKKMEDTSVVRRPGMYVCGIKGNQRRRAGRVMGGKSSTPGEWCWQVALINAKNQYLCGGALIGSRWVLTAAHCITVLVRNGDAIYVRVGDYDLASQYGTPGAQTQKVSTSYIHHNHNGQTLDNDIALLRLENPVQLQESVCLACLPARNAEIPPGTRCTVTGYGYMNEGGPVALKIREAVLPIVEETLCTEQINKVTEKRFILPTGSFCAGGESGNDACQGDGGGPLTCENEGYHELTGLVSWGFGCGKKDVPGVYVMVSSYIGWVNQIISVNN